MGSAGGQCATYQNPAWAQEGCAGQPVVAKAAQLWMAEPFLPAGGRYARIAFVAAAAGEPGDLGQHLRADMQKAWTEMNVQLANGISDLTGVTGMAILRAWVEGERNLQKLAQLKHQQIHASGAEIVQSLEGNWREELILVLRQSLDLYDFHLAKIEECDRQIETH
jgi:hypothetical protein